MTFTSEERREMAENLRHLTHDFDVVLDKLADLIDPEGGDDD